MDDPHAAPRVIRCDGPDVSLCPESGFGTTHDGRACLGSDAFNRLRARLARALSEPYPALP